MVWLRVNDGQADQDSVKQVKVYMKKKIKIRLDFTIAEKKNSTKADRFTVPLFTKKKRHVQRGEEK